MKVVIYILVCYPFFMKNRKALGIRKAEGGTISPCSRPFGRSWDARLDFPRATHEWGVKTQNRLFSDIPGVLRGPTASDARPNFIITAALFPVFHKMLLYFIDQKNNITLFLLRDYCWKIHIYKNCRVTKKV